METALIVALVLMAAAILALIAALLRSKQSGPVPTDDRLDSMNRELGEVKEGTRRMVEVGEEMRRVLGSPTLRGALGERMLERLLGEVLPASAYSTQHDLSNGNRVDAIVRLRDGQAVSVDSKFPLENYERLVEAVGQGQAGRRTSEALQGRKAPRRRHRRQVHLPGRDTRLRLHVHPGR